MLRNVLVSSNNISIKFNRFLKLRIPYKLFSTQNTNKEEKIEVTNSQTNSEKILVKIPQEFKQFYDFGITNELPLYQNYESLKYNTGSHIPLNKLNILLFGGLAVYGFYSSTFQIILLIQLYIFNKFLLKQNRKISEIVYISILPEMDAIMVKTHALSLKYDIGSLKFEKAVKIGQTNYLVLNDINSKMSFYLKEDAKCLNRELLEQIISGDSSSVSFEYI